MFQTPVRVAWEPVPKPEPAKVPELQPVAVVVTVSASPVAEVDPASTMTRRQILTAARRSRARKRSSRGSMLSALAVTAAVAAACLPVSAAESSAADTPVYERVAHVAYPAVKASLSGDVLLERAEITSVPAPDIIKASSTSRVSISKVMMHPVKSLRVTSAFGSRTNPLTGAPGQLHLGQDYAVACGTPVYASAAGSVIRSGWASWSGLRVDIDHGASGIKTGYSHNSKLVAKVGQQVAQGQLIAYSGTTGNSTGCHVHFETIRGDSFVNPSSIVGNIPGQRQSRTPDATEYGYSNKWGSNWAMQR